MYSVFVCIYPSLKPTARAWTPDNFVPRWFLGDPWNSHAGCRMNFPTRIPKLRLFWRTDSSFQSWPIQFPLNWYQPTILRPIGYGEARDLFIPASMNSNGHSSCRTISRSLFQGKKVLVCEFKLEAFGFWVDGEVRSTFHGQAQTLPTRFRPPLCHRNHAKILKGRPRRYAPWEIIPAWPGYTKFPPDHFGQVEMIGSTTLSNKSSTA